MRWRCGSCRCRWLAPAGPSAVPARGIRRWLGSLVAGSNAPQWQWRWWSEREADGSRDGGSGFRARLSCRSPARPEADSGGHPTVDGGSRWIERSGAAGRNAAPSSWRRAPPGAHHHVDRGWCAWLPPAPAVCRRRPTARNPRTLGPWHWACPAPRAHGCSSGRAPSRLPRGSGRCRRDGSRIRSGRVRAERQPRWPCVER